MSVRAFLWTIQRCREQAFQQFLGVEGEAAAARRVKEICGVESRVELDRDAGARALWDSHIRRPFMRYLEQLS